jgi:hypothetical protein
VNILLVGSQHGDELLGEKLYEYLIASNPCILPHIEFVIGNPIAHSKKVRYTESDMNRSYVDNPKTFEEKRAAEIIQYIERNAYDLVLDLHTTNCIQTPCLIVKDSLLINRDYIDASSIKNVVVMKHEIISCSLIGKVDQAIAIEVSNVDLGTELYEKISKDIVNYIYKKKVSCNKKYFEVTELLEKDELKQNQVETLINFKKSNYGFYPVLVGENSYKNSTHYLGFKAKRIYLNRGESK